LNMRTIWINSQPHAGQTHVDAVVPDVASATGVIGTWRETRAVCAQ
jgi:hypothetical protein